MNRVLHIVICLIQIIKLSQQGFSTPSSSNYTASVVEFDPKTYGNPIDTVNNRTNEYIALIASAEANTVDIIVFPEGTLNDRHTAAKIPRSEFLIAPCDSKETEYMSFVRKISCAARKHRKYVVINLTMKRNCTEDSLIYNDPRPCTENNINLYNTNVVFDRNGTVISTYRKYNLFGEKGITVPNVVDIAYFDTDFNVRFGHFVGMDLLFETPAIELINLGIRNILFPSMWFSELPFLTAVQIQQAWSERFNVNFLAAGVSKPSIGNTGSGIYHGIYGPLVSHMMKTSTTHLFMAVINKIPKFGPNKIQDKIIFIEMPYNIAIARRSELLPLLLQRENLTSYSSYFLDFNNNKTINTTVCSNEGFCCEFYARVSTSFYADSDYYRYYAVAFYGNRTFTYNSGVADGGILSCAVIACINDNFTSCGLQFPNGTYVSSIYKFLSLEITTNYTSRTFDVPMPNSLNTNIMPFHYPKQYQYKEIGNFTHQSPTGVKTISMTLLYPQDDILTFGIYGRTYKLNDGNRNSTNYIVFSVLLLSILSSIFNFV